METVKDFKVEFTGASKPVSSPRGRRKDLWRFCQPLGDALAYLTARILTLQMELEKTTAPARIKELQREIKKSEWSIKVLPFHYEDHPELTAAEYEEGLRKKGLGREEGL